MKLNLFSSKKFYVLISLYFLISSQSILAISNDRLKSKSTSSTKSQGKASISARGEPGFLMTYEATLIVENTTKNTKEEVAVYIDKKSIENNSYGFEVTPKDKAAKINSPVFFPLADGIYYFSLKALTSQVDCLNDGLFSKNGMNFMLSVGGDNITVTFKYPNSWAFGDKNDIDWLCRKISENYNNYMKKENEKKAVVIEAITRTTDLEVEQSRKISGKTELDKYISFQKTELEKETAKNDKLLLESENLKEKLKVIESSKGSLVKKNSDNDMEIASKEADIRDAESSIAEYSNRSKEVKEITNEDVKNRYLKVKDALLSMLKFHSEDDPMHKKIKELAESVQTNKDKILDSFK